MQVFSPVVVHCVHARSNGKLQIEHHIIWRAGEVENPLLTGIFSSEDRSLNEDRSLRITLKTERSELSCDNVILAVADLFFTSFQIDCFSDTQK